MKLRSTSLENILVGNAEMWSAYIKFYHLTCIIYKNNQNKILIKIPN